MESARCDPVSVILFTRQLAVLFQEGIPLGVALEGLVSQEDQRFSAILDKVTGLVTEGHTFSSSLARFPRVFGRVYIAMVAVGEKTGALHHSLDVLADWMERDHEWAQRIRSATSYPLFIIALTVGMTVLLFHSVMPGFLGIFTDMKVELPWLTRMVVTLTKAASNPGVWVLVIAGGGFALMSLREYGRTPRGASTLYRGLLSVPGVGPLVHSACMARYTCGLGTMLSGGAELLASLQMASQASNSPLLIADAPGLVDSITSGESLSDHMRERPDVYPTVLAHMAKVGEESGSMAQMFLRVSEYYAEEVNHRVDTLGATLEPLLLAMVGGMVGVIVLSLFLPLYTNISQLGM